MLERLLQPLFSLLFEPLVPADVHISLSGGLVTIARASLRADFANSVLHGLIPMLSDLNTYMQQGLLEVSSSALACSDSSRSLWS